MTRLLIHWTMQVASALCAIGLGLNQGASAAGTDWPQFRGPGASGVDDTRSLPVEWNLETGQNIRWQTPLPGLGHASPIISGDRVYVATVVGPADAELKVGLYGDISSVNEDGVHQWRLLAIATVIFFRKLLSIASGRICITGWRLRCFSCRPCESAREMFPC